MSNPTPTPFLLNEDDIEIIDDRSEFGKYHTGRALIIHTQDQEETKQQILSALKLQRLVEERIKDCDLLVRAIEYSPEDREPAWKARELLLSLLEESRRKK